MKRAWRRFTDCVSLRGYVYQPVHKFSPTKNTFSCRPFLVSISSKMAALSLYQTPRNLAFEISVGVAVTVSIEAPRRLLKREFSVKMCEDYEQAELFLKNHLESIRYTGIMIIRLIRTRRGNHWVCLPFAGMVFLQFVQSRFFAHPGGVAIGDLAGDMAFLPLKFYAKELNESGLGLLLKMLPTLESLLKDTAVIKIVEDRAEFWRHLDYMDWSLVSISPVLDLENVTNTSTRAKAGPLRALRTIFPANDPLHDWNADETICHGDRWHVQEYSITPTFTSDDPLSQVIAGQLYAMRLQVCRFLISRNSNYIALGVNDQIEFNYAILHRYLYVERDEKLPATYIVPKRTETTREIESVDVEMSLPEDERQGLLDSSPGQSRVHSPVKAQAKAVKNVRFRKELYYRSFEFGNWELQQEYEVTMRNWATMERASEVPSLEMPRATSKAMNRERCTEIIQKVQRVRKPSTPYARLPDEPVKGILRPASEETLVPTGEVTIVYDNHNDDMTWNLLAHLRHHRRHNNSRRASPPPNYFRKRPGIQCHTTLAAALIRQYDQDGDYEGQPLPLMAPDECDPEKARMKFPSYMNSAQIKAARKMDRTKLRKLVESDAKSGELITVLKEERKLVKSGKSSRKPSTSSPSAAKSVAQGSSKKSESIAPSLEERKTAQEAFSGMKEYTARNSGVRKESGGSIAPGSGARKNLSEGNNQGDFLTQSEQEPRPGITGTLIRGAHGGPCSGSATQSLNEDGTSGVKPGALGKRGVKNERTKRRHVKEDRATRSPKYSSSESSDLEDEGNYSFSETVIRGMTRRCRKYLRGIEHSLTTAKRASETKDVGTQTSPTAPRKSVFDRLSF